MWGEEVRKREVWAEEVVQLVKCLQCTEAWGSSVQVPRTHMKPKTH